MAYDLELAKRIREAVKRVKGVSEKAMFGGIAWFHRGHMFVGTMKDELFLRVGKEKHNEVTARTHARTADFMHKPMPGFVLVAAPGVETVPAIWEWAQIALGYTNTLPAKAMKAAKPKKRAGKSRSAKVAAKPRAKK